MNLEKIPLKTVRQFFIEDVVLADYEDAFTPETPQVTKKVEDLCYAKVPIKPASVPLSPCLLCWSSTSASSFCALMFCRSWRC